MQSFKFTAVLKSLGFMAYTIESLFSSEGYYCERFISTILQSIPISELLPEHAFW